VLDLTVVVGVDSHTVNFLKLTLPTWKQRRPILWEVPWLIFHDGLSAEELEWVKSIRHKRHLTLVAWSGQYFDQREKMLTGHVFVPCEFVRTSWWVKIDCDAIAVSSEVEWPNPEWFERDQDGVYNRLIASPWSYTRSKPDANDLEKWCDTLEDWGDIFGTPRMGLKDHIREHSKGPKMKMTRLASWIQFHRTEWVKSIAESCSEHFGEYRLPVPSHDTTLWIAAARSGVRFQFAKQQKFGWTNRTTMKGAVGCIEQYKEYQ